MIKSKNKVFSLLSLMLIVFICATGLWNVEAKQVNHLDVEFVNQKVQAYVGENIDLPIVHPLFPQYVDDYFFSAYDNDLNQIEIIDNCFTPLKQGKYKIVLSVLGKDKSSFSKSYFIDVSLSSAPILTSKPIYPVGLLDGVEYNIEKAQFTDFNSDNGELVDYVVNYIDDNNVKKTVSQSFVPHVSHHGNCIRLVYSAVSKVTNQSAEYSISIPVVQAITIDEWEENIYHYDKMFITHGVDSSSLDTVGARFNACNDFSLSFINKLDTEFSINISSSKNLANFESVAITISDSLDDSKNVVLTFSHIDNKKSYFNINGINNIVVQGSIISENGLNIFIDNNGNVLNSSMDVIGVIQNFYSGAEFNGFNSGFINLSIEVLSVTGNSSLFIGEINGQLMDKENHYDKISPYYKMDKNIPTTANLGDKIIIPKAIGFDVISPDVSSIVSVSYPDGDTIISVDNIPLYEVNSNRDYEFEVTKYGEYNIHYVVTDRDGNVFDSLYFSLYVRNIVPPVFTINDTIKPEVNVGDKITIPDISIVSDNNSDSNDMKVIISMNLAKGNYVRLTANEKFTFNQSGVYFLRYTVVDSFLNMTTIEQKIICK